MAETKTTCACTQNLDAQQADAATCDADRGCTSSSRYVSPYLERVEMLSRIC